MRLIVIDNRCKMIGKSVYVTETMLCTTLYYWALDNVQFLGSDSLPVNFFAVKGL